MTAAVILHDKGGEVVTASGSDTLTQICALLQQKKIGAVVVTDKDGKVSGMLSERDIVRAIARQGAAALEEQAKSFMTKEVVTCALGDSIETLMGKMTAGRFRHLPVIDNNALVGIVSIGDVVKQRIADVEHDAQALREYIATG